MLFYLFATGTNHLVLEEKKNAKYIASLFDPWIQKLDPGRTRVDCVFFMEQAMSN
jgi:hypothetical protein